MVKHILNKHGEKLEEHKNVIRDDLYWERYEQAKLAAHDAQRKAAKEREAAAAAAAATHAGADMGEAAAEWQVRAGPLGLLLHGAWGPQDSRSNCR